MQFDWALGSPSLAGRLCLLGLVGLLTYLASLLGSVWDPRPTWFDWAFRPARSDWAARSA